MGHSPPLLLALSPHRLQAPPATPAPAPHAMRRAEDSARGHAEGFVDAAHKLVGMIDKLYEGVEMPRQAGTVPLLMLLPLGVCRMAGCGKKRVFAAALQRQRAAAGPSVAARAAHTAAASPPRVRAGATSQWAASFPNNCPFGAMHCRTHLEWLHAALHCRTHFEWLPPRVLHCSPLPCPRHHSRHLTPRPIQHLQRCPFPAGQPTRPMLPTCRGTGPF